MKKKTSNLDTDTKISIAYQIYADYFNGKVSYIDAVCITSILQSYIHYEMNRLQFMRKEVI